MRVDVTCQPGLPAGRAQAAYLQEAVDRVHRAGGGVVSVGPGCYTMSTLYLRSGIELHLERGARLRAYPDLDAYRDTPSASGNSKPSGYHLMAALDCRDIAITGDGVIDGRDEQFWEPVHTAENRPFGIFRFTVRKRDGGQLGALVQLERCRNVRLADCTVTSAPGFAVHVFDCDVVSVSGLTVLGHPYGPHTDGIVINGSRDVRVAHCHVDTGDDAIIIKAAPAGLHCRNVSVTNCVLASNCAALGLGADVYGTISDVVFSNCVVNKSLRMIQVEMWFPGQVRRAVFSGISGRTFPDEGVENERPIYVDIQQQRRPERLLGEVEDMVFRDILCETRGRILMTAQDGARIDGVTLGTVVLTVPEIEDPAETVPRATSLQLSNFNPRTRAVRAAVVADNVHRLTMRDVEVRWPENPGVPMHGLCCRNVTELVDDCPRLRSTAATVERTRVISEA